MNTFILTRFAVSVVALTSIVGTSERTTLATAAVGLYAVVAAVRGVKALALLVVATLFMVLPLVLVHAIINPTFARTETLYGIPWRGDGASYALLVGLRMALLFVVVGIWMGLQRSVTIALVARSRLPALVAFALLQALFLSTVLSRRVSSIRLAQQSRGVLREGGLAQRVAGTVAMVVPLIATTLMDAHDRGDALARMGIGTVRIFPPYPLPSRSLLDVCLASMVTASALIAALHTVLNAN